MPQTWTTCGTQGSPGVSYTYDVAGIRDSKTVTTSSGTITYNYLTQNGQVVRQTWTDLDHVSHVMDFIYDNNGKPYAFYYDGTLYYYITNLQGDVIRIIDTAGATICTYTYDAWGRLLNSSTNQIFKANPIRYRGYYYDTESGLYYLGSRYYDPQVKRFINADGAAFATINPYSNGLTDKNYFAYCDNNPVSRSDDGGEFWNLAAGAVIGAAISAVSQVVGNVASGEHWSNGVLVATASVAASGALAATGVGRLGQTIGNAVISGAAQAVNELKSGTLFTQQGATATLKAAAAGAMSGFIGGNGARHKKGDYYKAAQNAKRTALKVFGKKYSNPATPAKLLNRAIRSVKYAAKKVTISTSWRFAVGAIYSQYYTRS